jgi:hypothetical protein
LFWFSFGGFGPWLFGSFALGSVVRERVMWGCGGGSSSAHGRWEVRKKEEESGPHNILYHQAPSLKAVSLPNSGTVWRPSL